MMSQKYFTHATPTSFDHPYPVIVSDHVLRLITTSAPHHNLFVYPDHSLWVGSYTVLAWAYMVCNVDEQSGSFGHVAAFTMTCVC